MGRLSGKVAIVTGATSGIGEATAFMYGKEGAKVVLAGRNEEKGNANAKAICDAGGEAIFVRTDSRKADDLKALVKSTTDKYGRIDILVNNAGMLIHKWFHEQTEEDFYTIMETNYLAYIRLMWAVLPIMQKQHSGSVINVASISAVKPNIRESFYAGFKGAINNLTKCLVLEYGKDNIRLNTLCPGPINTNMTPKDIQTNPEARKAVESLVPIGRLGEPDDLAYTAVFLGSDESSFVNGATIIVDGGLSY
ncbi:MAG TPA: SDR family oxidoreductase [Negativicutes bacterium]